MSLSVFNASYYWSGGYGAYEDMECIVVANTSSEALGLVLAKFQNTKAKGWSILEIDTASVDVHLISDRGS